MMNTAPAVATDDPSEEVIALVRKLQATQRRLEELTGGEVDAVLFPGGQSYMLGAAQESLRQSETALRASLDDFHTLAEAMPQIVWRTGPDGSNDYFNQYWVKYTGLTLVESLGDGWVKAFHPEDRERAWKAWQQATEGKSEYSVECRLCRADGQYRWWLVRALPLKDAEGTILKWFGTCTDIHDFKIAGMEIVRMNRALKMLSECNEILVRTKDEAELLEKICRVVVEVGGYRMAWVGFKQDDEAKSIKPMAHAGAEEGYLSAIKVSWNENEPIGQGPAGQVINSGQTVLFEDFAKHETVTPWLSEINNRGYRGTIFLPLRNNHTFGFLGLYSGDVLRVSNDETKLLEEMADDLAFGILTLRSQAEQKRTESRFRRLIESNAQGVLFWNTKAQITEANEAFLKLVGYTRADLETGPLDWMAMTPPEYASLDQDALKQIADTGVCTPFEKEYIRKDGKRVPILIGAASFEDAPNEGVCFVVDLTERKKLEQQFFRAQRMESIGTLAGGIAHDLNNVLAPIIMSIDLLKMKFTDQDSQELLATLKSSAQRGADMVRQVLSFARGVEGRKMDVQVKHILQDVEKIATDTFPKNIQMRSLIPNDLGMILGDPTQVHQVLLNLCVNARDAMPSGGILTISAENVHVDAHYAGLNLDAHPGAYVMLQVTDTGTGMPPGVVEKIFDPFFTTKEIGNGTGLGLSTSLAIVKSHGGFIRVYSEIGKGTTFKAYFPAQTGPSTEAGTKTAAELPRGNGELILVVDDEVSVREITRKTLEGFGYRVVVASDGAEAVADAARLGAEIAVVLTDMMMPVMDGPATIQVLLKLNPNLPIIAASGLTADGRITQAEGLGVRHFLSKPYSAEALLLALRQILSSK